MAPRTVDYRDLSIAVSDKLLSDVTTWLKDFNDNFDNIVIEPKLRGDVLSINSLDLVHFLGFADSRHIPELDWKRFRRDLESQMKLHLQKSIHPDLRYHYQWCLTALQSFEEGRYRPGTSDESA